MSAKKKPTTLLEVEVGCVVECVALGSSSTDQRLIVGAAYRVEALRKSPRASPSIKLWPLDGISFPIGFVKFTRRRFLVTRSRAEVDRLLAFS